MGIGCPLLCGPAFPLISGLLRASLRAISKCQVALLAAVFAVSVSFASLAQGLLSVNRVCKCEAHTVSYARL